MDDKNLWYTVSIGNNEIDGATDYEEAYRMAVSLICQRYADEVTLKVIDPSDLSVLDTEIVTHPYVYTPLRSL